MPDLSPAFEAFIVLSVVVDPIGNVPIFLALTAGQTTAQQRHSALQATLVAGGLIGVFALVGRQILTALGIGLPALQVAGLARVLRTNGINLVTQVMGLLAAAIAVQFVAEDIEQWVRGSV